MRASLLVAGLTLGAMVPAMLKADPEYSALGKIGYEPPAPGTYALPPIKPAVDGIVLDTRGNSRRLIEYMGQGPVVLSFIYTTCSDTRGCPLATHVLHRLAAAFRADPEISGEVRLITLSFDPERDTPEVMHRYAESVAGERPEENRHWAFLTTASRAELQPILDGYGQYVVRERDANGRETGAFAHVLKVFLIDRKHRVRNIYSTSFLYPELLMTDIRTLLLEQPK